MIQITGQPVTLNISVEDAPLATSNACPSPDGCTEVALFTSASTSAFALIGSAQQYAHAIDSLTLLAPAIDGECADGCGHRTAADEGLVDYAVLRFNPVTEKYDNLSDAGALDPWQSAWFIGTSALSGFAASYLFPAPDTIDNGECQNAPALPPLTQTDPGKTIITVSTEAELQSAVSNLTANSVILIEPGVYQLSDSIWIRQDDVTIRGNSNSCDAIRLVGMGMDNAAGQNTVPHGVWTDANNTKIQNLSIEEVWYHPIATDPYNVRMINAGEQFVKISGATDEQGTNNGRLEYSVMKYTDGTPKTDHGPGLGYTQGISLHNGDNWVISNNRFENFHTRDTDAYLWNPVVTAWSSSRNTLVENNVFIDVDRAIAFGLKSQENDHSGGIIRNNMVVLRENLFSEQRKSNADAPIIVWNSPNSQVLHNTVVTNGNTPFAIELRFNSNGAIIRNNLADAPNRDRSSNQYVDVDNILFDDTSIFVDADNGDLHLRAAVDGVTNAVPVLEAAPQDIDGQNRSGNLTDAGADVLQ